MDLVDYKCLEAIFKANAPQHSRVVDAWEVLSQTLLRDKSNLLETKAWLLATITSQEVVGVASRQVLLDLLSEGKMLASKSTGFVQLLQLFCEQRPATVAKGVLEEAELLQQFFLGSDMRIAVWFGHFSMEGMSKFKYGAYALAHYALAERSEVWQHLVWEGKHPQAPVAVASKPHYFCELNVTATVRNLALHCKGFWSSEQLKDSLASGEFLTVDYPFFIELLLKQLQNSDWKARQLWQALNDYVLNETWATLCTRLLHALNERQTLQLVNSFSSPHSITNAVGHASSSSVILSPPAWENYYELAFCHAITCARQQVYQVLRNDEELIEELGVLQDLARTIFTPTVTQQSIEALVENWVPKSRRWITVFAYLFRLHLSTLGKESPDLLKEVLHVNKYSCIHAEPGMSTSKQGKRRKKEQSHKNKKKKRCKKIDIEEESDWSRDLLPIEVWSVTQNGVTVLGNSDDMAELLAAHACKIAKISEP